MKKKTVRLTALGLSAVLALGGVSGAVCARAAGNGGPSVRTPAAAAENLTASSPAAGPAAYRDETVYVMAGADGAVERVIVSDWLKNPDGLAQLEDTADLIGAENVKGYETSSPSGEGRVWNAQGGDIYCQGSTSRELPVDVSVTYTLDGQPILPGQLAGKSGKVTIRFDYANRQYETAAINGESEQICVPFVMLTTVVLDGSRFTNVEAENARIYSDGDRLAVAGAALPGLRESLHLAEDVELPEYVEITADVIDFELESTYTVAINSLFADFDADKLDGAAGLSGSLDELADAMEQLLDGSGRLYGSLGELLEKSGELAAGVDRLASGGAELQSGAGELAAGAARMEDGTAALLAGLEQLTAGSDALNSGAAQVFESLLASAAQQLTAAGVQVPELTAENYSQVLDGVMASLGDSPAVQQIAGIKASLDSYNAFYQGLMEYTAGAGQAAAGAKDLANGAENLSQGAASLSGGAKDLSGGLLSLQQSIPALTDGIMELHNGAGELSDGLEAFSREGIRKLLDAFDGDMVQRLQAAVNAAKNYRSFSGGNEADGQVKFIYRTAAVRAE